jgi:hypothetical protein
MPCPFWTQHNRTAESCPAATANAFWLENDGGAFDSTISGFGDGRTVRTVGNDWVPDLSWIVGPYSGTPTSVVAYSLVTVNAGQNSMYVVARLAGLTVLADWSYAGNGTAVGLAVSGDMHLVRIRPDPGYTSLDSDARTVSLTMTASYAGTSYTTLTIQARFQPILV